LELAALIPGLMIFIPIWREIMVEIPPLDQHFLQLVVEVVTDIINQIINQENQVDQVAVVVMDLLVLELAFLRKVILEAQVLVVQVAEVVALEVRAVLLLVELVV